VECFELGSAVSEHPLIRNGVPLLSFLSGLPLPKDYMVEEAQLSCIRPSTSSSVI